MNKQLLHGLIAGVIFLAVEEPAWGEGAYKRYTDEYLGFQASYPVNWTARARGQDWMWQEYNVSFVSPALSGTDPVREGCGVSIHGILPGITVPGTAGTRLVDGNKSNNNASSYIDLVARAIPQSGKLTRGRYKTEVLRRGGDENFAWLVAVHNFYRVAANGNWSTEGGQIGRVIFATRFQGHIAALACAGEPHQMDRYFKTFSNIARSIAPSGVYVPLPVPASESRRERTARLKQGCSACDPTDCVEYGRLYWHGVGVKKNRGLARRLYQKGCSCPNSASNGDCITETPAAEAYIRAP